MNARHGDPTPEGVNTLHVALGYIAKHKGKRFIFPLAPGRKGRPLIKDNLTRACNDPDQIERWHDRWPGCAWGCACKKSGIVCVDIDAGNDKQGMKSVHALKTAGFTFSQHRKRAVAVRRLAFDLHGRASFQCEQDRAACRHAELLFIRRQRPP